jgi:hypothetical protein
MMLTLDAGAVDVGTGFDGAATKSAKSSSAMTKSMESVKENGNGKCLRWTLLS